MNRDQLPPSTFFGILLLSVLLVAWGPCKHTAPPIVAPVVAPAGAATAAVTPAIAADAAAGKAVLSTVSASAGAILAINATQPPGPTTTGVADEAAIIIAAAGPPTDADRLKASERARVVADGDLKKIAAQYQTATSEATAAKTRADAAEKALADAQAAAKAEQATQQAKFQAAIDKVTGEANARVDAALLKAKAEADAKLNFWLQIGCFGGGVLFLMAAGVVMYLKVTMPLLYPLLGPNIAALLAVAGAGLLLLGLIIRAVDRFVDQHPYLFYWGLLGVVGAAGAAAVIAYVNHRHSLPVTPVVPKPVTP